MPTYITLYKLTDQGIRNIKEGPARYEAGRKLAESMGGKILGFYAVLGEYDYVAISEFPDDQTATACLLAVGSRGNVKTTTMKAFTVEEFKEILKKLP